MNALTLASIAFILPALGLIGLNLSYSRALKDERQDTDAWRNTARSLLQTVLLLQSEFDERAEAAPAPSDDTLFLPEIDWAA